MERINFGPALYGRGYTLEDPSYDQAHGTCYFTAGNKPGLCTRLEGIISLTEIRALIESKGLEPVPLGDGTTMMKQITWDDKWIGFDDEASILEKLNYANAHCFGGTMAWNVDLDSGDRQLSKPPTTIDGLCGPKNGRVCPSGQCCSSLGVSVMSQRS